MKSILLRVLSFILACTLMFTFISCSTPEPPSPCPPHNDGDDDGVCDKCGGATEPDTIPDLSGISLEDKVVAYDGKEHSLEISGKLPEGVSVEYVGGKATEVGSHTVKARFFYKDKEIANSELTATLTVTKGNYDMSGVHLLSVTKTYDGKEVVPTLSGNLPDGVTAEFAIRNSLGEAVEKIIDIGVYTVYASFSSDNEGYYPIEPVSATFTVRDPSDCGVSFEDKTVIYDGKAHSIEITGELPEGVIVVYRGGAKTDVGVYKITARFFLNDEELADERLTATLTIVKATFDMSGVSAVDTSGEYNGASHAPTLSGELPEGVMASYSYKDAFGNEVSEIVEAGVYKVTVSFIYDTDCYNEINPVTFTYTVTRAESDVSELYPTSLSKTYDGKAVKPTLSGTLPSGVEVKYAYADASGNPVSEIVNAGEYTVVASFFSDGENYGEPVSFVYTVTKGYYDLSGLTLEPVTKTYDGKPVMLSLGELPAGLIPCTVIKNSLGETVEEMVNAGKYNVTVSFEGDYNNYHRVSDMYTYAVIERIPIGGISFTGAVFKYDGTAKNISASGIPEWMTVTYTGNAASAPGRVTVTASFSERENYARIAPMQAEIIIEIDDTTPTQGIKFSECEGGYEVIGIDGNKPVVIIPATYEGKPVVSVKKSAFEKNNGLSYVYIPSGVESIGEKAFADCKALQAVKLGSIKEIGKLAFKGTAIKEIYLPDSLESIGHAAFQDTSLEKITLPFIGGSRSSSGGFIGFLFGGTTYLANARKVPTTLTSVVLSHACQELPARAFYEVASLREVALGSGITKIGNSAFLGCSSLRSIHIPKSVIEAPANDSPEDSPFYGTGEDMMIVIESIGADAEWGRYFAHIGENKTATVKYGKTYGDYVINRESYRTPDPSDASLSLLFAGKYLVPGFNPSVYEYTVESDVNVSLSMINMIASAPDSKITVAPATAANGNVASVTVNSMNGEKSLVYKIKFNVTGSFTGSAEVVNKNGAKGTVTFVVDDGYKPTANFMKSMIEKYSRLAVSYAIKTNTLLSTDSKYDDGLIVDDIDGDGMLEYVLDENGKYTYVTDKAEIDFWKEILSAGRSEVVAHSHTHAFWGVNDNGGAQLTASTAGDISTRIQTTLVEGSASKEVYASMQIIKDIFGDTFGGLTYVNAGIPPKEGDTAVTEEVSVYISNQTVRVLEDTEITVKNGRVFLKNLTWVNLQSTVGTLNSGSVVTTTADVSSGVIPKDTPIYLSGHYVTVPPVDNQGNRNVIKGFKAFITDIYRQAYEDGTIIGGRTSGQQVYTAKDFLNPENRILRRAYIIATSTNEARPESWKTHIDNAIAADGGWASFCIHAMTEDISETGQGGHKITWEQAEDLFKYACDKGDDLWIATQTDATLYYHQWSTSTVTSSFDEDNNSISVSLTDKENDEVYKMPLTVKVTVPGNWSSATINGEELTIRTDNNGSCYVYVDVAPETTVSVKGK